MASGQMLARVDYHQIWTRESGKIERGIFGGEMWMGPFGRRKDGKMRNRLRRGGSGIGSLFY